MAWWGKTLFSWNCYAYRWFIHTHQLVDNTLWIKLLGWELRYRHVRYYTHDYSEEGTIPYGKHSAASRLVITIIRDACRNLTLGRRLKLYQTDQIQMSSLQDSFLLICMVLNVQSCRTSVHALYIDKYPHKKDCIQKLVPCCYGKSVFAISCH